MHEVVDERLFRLVAGRSYIGVPTAAIIFSFLCTSGC